MNEFILNLAAVSFSEFIRIVFFSDITSIKPELSNKNILYIFIISLIYNILSLYSHGVIKFFLLSILSIFLYKTLFKIETKDILFYFSIIHIMSELLILPIEFLLKLYINQKEILIESDKYLKFYLIFLHSIVYVIFLHRKSLKDAAFVIHGKVSIKKNYFKNVVCIFIFLGLFHYILEASPVNVSMVIFTIYIVLTISFLLRSIVLQTSYLNDNYIPVQEYNSLKRKYIDISKDFSNTRHNLLNDFLAIKTSKDYLLVIDSLIKKYKRAYQLDDMYMTSKFGLAGLIDVKINNAKKYGVKVIYDEKDKIDSSTYSNVDYVKLCEAVGIVIDNAIEASIETTLEINKVVYINVCSKNGLHIKVINMFDNPVDIDKMFVANYSSKKRSSGIGLNYLHELERDGIYSKVNIIENRFIVNIDV